mmetsp:Transcript_62366/g.126755  ORF Transcript_62366/g.126755 Transcript_62366/m.126755 type:complete len:223 (-) Transcript_62366:26-694(-)
MSRAMENTLFNLKFTSKQLQRQSKKCEKSERSAKKKVEKAIKKGNMEGAKIYAANAIREKNQALNYLRLSSRIDAVAARVETAVRMNSLTKSMGGVVKGMDKVLGSMDVSKISVMMDKFEKQFDDLDVRSAYMEGAMGEATSTSTPQSEVDSLVGQVAAKAGLDLGDQLASAGAVGTNVAAAAPAAAGRTAVGVGAAPTATGGGGGGGVADDLAARLANLKK